MAKRAAIADAVRRESSQLIMQYAYAFLHDQKAESVLAYRSMAAEVETTVLHSQDHQAFKVYAPVCGAAMTMAWYSAYPSIWKKSAHGVLEPKNGELWRGGTNTWLLCPLVGFDRTGQRIGMGKGYFDRWLANNRDAVAGVIGLAFAEQEVNKIPFERHDQPLDGIITEKGMMCLNP